MASSLLFAAALLWLFVSQFPAGWKQLSAEMFLHDASLSAMQTSLADQATRKTSAAWQKLDQRVLANQRDIYWLRFRLQAPANRSAQTQGLWLAVRGASEIYLDGELLGRNGIVGNSIASEVPGTIDWRGALPIAQTSSTDTIELLIRVSSQRLPHFFASADAYAFVGDDLQLQTFQYRRWLVAALAYGAILVACFYFVVIQPQLRAPDRAGLCLLLLCAVGLVLPCVEAWRFLWVYTYPWHAPRLLMLQVLHFVAALLLVAYLSLRFQVRWRGPWLWCFVGFAVFIWLLGEGADLRMWLVQVLGLAAAIATMLRAPRDADWLSIISLLISMLILALLTGGAFLDGLYFIALAVLTVSLLLAHTRELLHTSERAVQLEAERTRLRAELLKRGMQPHWLLNTLTAMQELIEQEPKYASAMVERLAAEFQNLRRISERALIALSEELALCQNHLGLRELVHGLEFSWQVDGSQFEFELPPGMLHALIENAFTHCGAKACAQAGFELQVEQSGADKCLRLSVPLARESQRARQGHGTGSAFIRASLQVSYPNQWQFTQQAQAGRWIAQLSWQCAS